LEKLVELLSTKVYSVYQGGKQIFNFNILNSEIIDERKFAKKIVKIYKALVHLESNKVSSSTLIAPNIRTLAKYLKTFFSS
jgi:hypothetical protein